MRTAFLDLLLAFTCTLVLVASFSGAGKAPTRQYVVVYVFVGKTASGVYSFESIQVEASPSSGLPVTDPKLPFVSFPRGLVLDVASLGRGWIALEGQLASLSGLQITWTMRAGGKLSPEQLVYEGDHSQEFFAALVATSEFLLGGAPRSSWPPPDLSAYAGTALAKWREEDDQLGLPWEGAPVAALLKAVESGTGQQVMRRPQFHGPNETSGLRLAEAYVPTLLLQELRASNQDPSQVLAGLPRGRRRYLNAWTERANYIETVAPHVAVGVSVDGALQWWHSSSERPRLLRLIAEQPVEQGTAWSVTWSGGVFKSATPPPMWGGWP